MNLIITGANLEDDFGHLKEKQKKIISRVIESFDDRFEIIAIVLPKHFENLPIKPFLSNTYPKLRLKFVNKTPPY
jgi:hypothetical protein